MSTSKVAGRSGRPWRRIKAQVLATSDICWLCGHPGSDSVDHVIARAICIATGRLDLIEDLSNLRAAHHLPCPDCHRQCNRERGMGIKGPQERQSRRW